MFPNPAGAFVFKHQLLFFGCISKDDCPDWTHIQPDKTVCRINSIAAIAMNKA